MHAWHLPGAATRSNKGIFRLSVELEEEIDSVILEETLQVVLKSIPVFALKLRYGLFWNYMEMAKDKPSVEEGVRNSMVRRTRKLNKHFLFCVRYFGKRISLYDSKREGQQNRCDLSTHEGWEDYSIENSCEG